MRFISYFLLVFIPVNWNFVKHPHDKVLLTVQEVCVSQSRCSRPCCAVPTEWRNVELYSSLSVPLGSVLNCTVTCVMALRFHEGSRGAAMGPEGAAWSYNWGWFGGMGKGSAPEGSELGTSPHGRGHGPELLEPRERWDNMLSVCADGTGCFKYHLGLPNGSLSQWQDKIVAVQSLGGTVCPSSHKWLVFPPLAMIKSYGRSFIWKSHCIHCYIY